MFNQDACIMQVITLCLEFRYVERLYDLFIYIYFHNYFVNIFIHYRMITVIIDFLSMSFAFVWMYSIFVMYAVYIYIYCNIFNTVAGLRVGPLCGLAIGQCSGIH